LGTFVFFFYIITPFFFFLSKYLSPPFPWPGTVLAQLSSPQPPRSATSFWMIFSPRFFRTCRLRARLFFESPTVSLLLAPFCPFPCRSRAPFLFAPCFYFVIFPRVRRPQCREPSMRALNFVFIPSAGACLRAFFPPPLARFFPLEPCTSSLFSCPWATLVTPRFCALVI